jgi:hypothetical protein
MIDSLKLYTREFSLSDSHKLTWDAKMSSGGNIVSEDRHKKVHMENGWCATVDDGNKSGKILYVDGSVPKLLYGTSLDECKESDYDRTVAALKDSLHKSGILIPSDAFESEMKLSRVDWCRNVKVSHPIPSYLSVLSKYDMPRMDKETWNSETILWKNSRHQFTMYDKIAQVLDKETDTRVLARVKGMAHDKFRIEYRELRGTGIKKVFGKSAKLSDVFDEKLSRKLLVSKVGTLVRRNDDEPVDGNVDLAEMLRKAKGKVRVLRGLIGSHGIMAQCGDDAEQLMSFFLACGVPKRTAYWYKRQILIDCAKCVTLDAAMLIDEIRQKLAA